jgi:hypothetical protein
MWPTFDEYKRSIEKWLTKNHPDYLNELGDREWSNLFSGRHHSAVIIINQLKYFFTENVYYVS